MVRMAWSIFLLTSLWLSTAKADEPPMELRRRSADADAWVSTLQSEAPEMHLDFVTQFPRSRYAGIATHRLYWLLERQMEAAGPAMSIPWEVALRPLRDEFLPRLVRTVPALPAWGEKGRMPLVDWPDPYHWMRDIDKRWWLHALPGEARDRLLGELMEGYHRLIVSEEGRTRCRACDAVGYLGFRDALGRLQMVAATDDECRVAAIRAIGTLQDPRAAAFLLAQLEGGASYAVIDALAALGTNDAVPAIAALTRAQDAWTRRQACEALGLIGDARGLGALEQRARDENEDELWVRPAAIEALGRLGDAGAVPTLRSTMKADFGLYKSSVEALGRIGSDDAVALLSADIAEKRNVMGLLPSRALAACDHPQSTVVLLETFYQAEIAGAHFSLDDQPPDPIFQGAEDEFRRFGCGECVAIVWSFRSVDRLLAVLEGESDALRGCAAYALGRAAVRDPRAVEALIPLLEEKGVAASAAFALGQLGDTRALEPLIGALQHEEAVVRRFAAHGLGDLGDRRAVAPLVRLLEDPDAGLAAVLALRRMKAKEAAPALAAMLLRMSESRSKPKNADALEASEKDGTHDASARSSLPPTANVTEAESAETTPWTRVTRGDLLDALDWIGNPAVIPAVLEIARDAPDPLRAEAARVVEKLREPAPEAKREDWAFHGPFDAMTDDEVKEMLVDADRAAYVGERVFAELTYRHLLPESADEAIRYFILQGARDDLVALWPRTRRVLLADLHSGSPQRRLYSARCLIRIGYEEDSVRELIGALSRSNDERMALEYFNCGNQQLREAARRWSEERGTILESRATAIAWAAMKEQ